MTGLRWRISPPATRSTGSPGVSTVTGEERHLGIGLPPVGLEIEGKLPVILEEVERAFRPDGGEGPAGRQGDAGRECGQNELRRRETHRVLLRVTAWP